MLEIAIIVVVTLILFLILKNFPNTRENSSNIVRKNSFMKKIFDKLFSSFRRKNEDEIKKVLKTGQDKIVSPKEISDAKKSFWTEDPEIAKILYEANKAILGGNYAVAEKKAIEALSKDKRCDQAYVFIALVAMHKKKYDEAIESAKAALKCNKDNASAHAILGECCFMNEKYSDSIESFQKAVNIDHNRAEWQAGLGKAYLEIRQFSKAAKALKRAASLDIDSKEYRELASFAQDKQKMHSSTFRK